MRSCQALCLAAIAVLLACADACGCNGCFYEEQSACARCCTAFIKRSGAPALSDGSDGSLPSDADRRSLVELVRRLDSARFVSPYRSFRVEDFVDRERMRRSSNRATTLFRRDTCGCAMGCFFSEASDCARCCSQGLRRNTEAALRSQSEQSLADIIQAISAPKN